MTDPIQIPLEYQNIRDYLNNLYHDVSTSSVSIEGRKKLNLYENNNYIYGDVILDSLYQIISSLAPKPGEVYYDLGCGGCRALIFAALCFPFAKCVGIDLIDTLTDLAQTKLKTVKEDTKNPNLNVEILNKNFLEVDLSDAGIIYAHATCFDADLMKNITAKLDRELKPGARVVLVTKQLYEAKFKFLREEKAGMEWGQATINYYEKL
jgi:hypothetical protein